MIWEVLGYPLSINPPEVETLPDVVVLCLNKTGMGLVTLPEMRKFLRKIENGIEVRAFCEDYMNICRL